MAGKRLDLVVIGTGSAASAAAFRCRKAGWEVAVIDYRPFGGTCVLRGCDPKKMLIAGAEAVDWVRRMRGRGVQGEVRIAWRELMRFKRSYTDSVPEKRESSFSKQRIATFHGHAGFVGPTTVSVNGDVLEARHVLIATGARPASLAFPGAEHLATSDAFLELDELPKRLVFVGGGYISFEFAHLAVRAGAEVTILHRHRRPLQGFDPDIVDRLVEHSRRLGIHVELNAEVSAIERAGSGVTVHAKTLDGERTFPADLAVHGAGRVPEIDALDLDRGGVERGRRGVKVNEFLQSTSNSAVYAAGDAAETDGMPLTPVAGYEGRMVAANLLRGPHAKPDYAGIPSVVFTLPPLATVGVGEEAASRRGVRFRVNAGDTSWWYSSRRRGEECSGYKVLVEEDTDRILGAHLLGPHAEEVINVFAVAIRAGLTASQLKESVFAYPTHASDVAYML